MKEDSIDTVKFLYMVVITLGILILFVSSDYHIHKEEIHREEIYVGSNLVTGKLLTREDLEENEWDNKLVERIEELESRIEILENKLKEK